jgi:hypothetical protein
MSDNAGDKPNNPRQRGSFSCRALLLCNP